MKTPVETSTTEPQPEDGIAERIRKIREQLRLSQTQFHQRTKEGDPEGKGISRTVLIGYEAGKFKPGARELRILCKTFNLSPTWLLLGDDSELGDEIEVARSMLFGGIGEPGLEKAFELALGLMCLKTHEREALGTLVHGIASSRRGSPNMEALVQLAGWMAQDAVDRLVQLTGDADGLEAVRKAKGPKKLEQMALLYEEAYKARLANSRE